MQKPATQPVRSQPTRTTNATPKPKPAMPEIKLNAIAKELPEVNREFRAAWIATVANINWPSKNNLSTAQQKAEAIRQLDMLQDNNFNAVIFQVRPSGDALYKSDLEPWSYFLNGETGRAPSPYYDPLEFWISEAHKRGMELHVWLNPFRAHHTAGGTVSPNSMAKRMGSSVVRLQNGTYWFDPADQKTQDHVSAVVKDLVKRYDLDGVHFDDYFYPYATYNAGKDFPDDRTWSVYKASGGTLSRADWRRGNVNKFVKRIYDEIKAEKKTVKFGISPFGIWKPGYPSDVKGSSQHDELFADAKLWLNQGWIDYFTPQLYWPLNSSGQNFSSLLKWWQSENTKNRHLWPGLNTVEVKAADRPAEIVNEINEARRLTPSSKGVAHWSIAGLLNSSAMQSALKNGPYKEKALVPRTPWISAENSTRPEINAIKSGNMVNVSWSAELSSKTFRWILFSKYGGSWKTDILEANTSEMSLPASKQGKNLEAVAIKEVDRVGNESQPAVFYLN